MVKLLPKWNTVSQAQQKKGQKIALFDQIKLKNEPKNQFQSVFFFAWKVGPAIIFQGAKKFRLLAFLL